MFVIEERNGSPDERDARVLSFAELAVRDAIRFPFPLSYRSLSSLSACLAMCLCVCDAKVCVCAETAAGDAVCSLFLLLLLLLSLTESPWPRICVDLSLQAKRSEGMLNFANGIQSRPAGGLNERSQQLFPALRQT